MRIAVAHSVYRSDAPSGENLVVEQEVELLRSAGHEVAVYARHSDEIADWSLPRKASVPARLLTSPQERRRAAEWLARVDPDVVHVHNTFPMIGPAMVQAARRASLPVVATVHNFRHLCAQAAFLRDGAACEDCLGRAPWPALAHACYRDSRLATLPLAGAIAFHRSRDTWSRNVDRFVAPNEFVRRQHVRGGFPANRFVVKPHFVPPPARQRSGPGRYFLYLGRLSEEKGADLLLDAWQAGFGELLVVGDGPERAQLERVAAGKGGVSFLGRRSRAECMDLLLRARALVNPARSYETFGLTVVEAFAHGVPAVVPEHGVFPDLVVDGHNGHRFAPNDADDLRRALQRAGAPVVAERLGRAAATTYRERFTPEQNLRRLETIYREVVDEVASGGIRQPRSEFGATVTQSE